MHDRTTQLDEHKITAAARLNLPATEPELYKGHLLSLAYARLATIHDEHQITARLNLPDTELQDTNHSCSWATSLQYIVHVTCYKGHAL